MPRLAAAGMLALLCGCASITAQKTELLMVNSMPRGAEVRLNGNIVGHTPARVDVPRQMMTPVIEVSRTGYSTESCRVTHSAGGGYVAADVVMCILLFPIGCVSFIDANGSWNELVETQCTVSLQPTATSSEPIR